MFLIFLLFARLQSYPQSTDITQKLILIQDVKKHCQKDLKMDIPISFYKNWAPTDTTDFYLYVSKKDTLYNFLDRDYKPFGSDFMRAQGEKRKYDSLGFHTLLYQSCGNINVQLSYHLLSYSMESISFIAFHEAAHLHLRANGNIPYILEEAVCDLIANYSTLELFSSKKGLFKEVAIKQMEQIEGIATEINSYLKILEPGAFDESEIDYSELKKSIERLSSYENRFIVERYNTEINNAYFIRNRAYTKYYFLLKELLMLDGKMKTFLRFIINLPSVEAQSICKINEEIYKLSMNKNL